MEDESLVQRLLPIFQKSTSSAITKEDLELMDNKTNVDSHKTPKHQCFRSFYLRTSGGPDGELSAAIRYISQRFTMVTPEAKAILNDIGI